MSKYRKIVRSEFGQSRSDGVIIRFEPKRQMIDVYGFYNSFCAIEGEELNLKDFFDRVGITEEDCKKVFLVVDKKEESL